MTASVTAASAEDAEAVCAIDRLVIGHGDRAPHLRAAISARHCKVARLHETVVGFAVCSPSFFSHSFIELAVVHPDYRRRGVATALLRHFEAECPEDRLFTSTNGSNTAMQRVLRALAYERSGFIENLDDNDPELIYVKWLARR